MGRFGSRVIGAEKVAAEQAIRRRNPGRRFGARVLGDVMADRAEIEAKEKDQSLAAKKARASRKAAKEAAETRAADADEKVEEGTAPILTSLKEMTAALDSNPALYEKLYVSELDRAEGPRKGTLRLFLSHELDNANRDQRIEDIQQMLKG